MASGGGGRPPHPSHSRQHQAVNMETAEQQQQRGRQQQPLPPPPQPPPDYFATYVEEQPPPSYNVAAELPTYEEAERTKGKYDDEDGAAAATPQSPGQHSNVTLLTLPSLSGSEFEDGDGGGSGGVPDTTLLGNDFVFFTAFVTAFLFNWIGFLLLMCFCHTIAARYGALSGFGLSLTKWTLIVKRSTDLANAASSSHGYGHHHLGRHGGQGGADAFGASAADGNSWLWWLIMAFGLLICVRAIVQYLHIKRAWGGLSTAARERLFFFY